MVHPKFVHYPHRADYGFHLEFRPFVTFVQPALYRSPSVNVDAYGVREQYDAEGRFIDLAHARDGYESCDVMLGGSTAFGVGSTSDRATIEARLTTPGRPCLNLGIRAASSRQELAMFLALRHLLPPVRAVVLLSGFNECLLAASDAVRFYPGYGALFSAHVEASLDASGADGLAGAARDGREPASTAPGGGGRALSRVSRVARRSLGPLVQGGDELVRRARDLPALLRTPDAGAGAGAPGAPGARPSELPFEKRLDQLLAMADGSLEAWSWMQKALGIDVHYVLQPAVCWGHKRLTAIEQECYDADVASVPGVERVIRTDTYDLLKARMGDACARHGVGFHDGNEWLAAGTVDDLELFSDVAHLTDMGNALFADWLRKEIPL